MSLTTDLTTTVANVQKPVSGRKLAYELRGKSSHYRAYLAAQPNLVLNDLTIGQRAAVFAVSPTQVAKARQDSASRNNGYAPSNGNGRTQSNSRAELERVIRAAGVSAAWDVIEAMLS